MDFGKMEQKWKRECSSALLNDRNGWWIVINKSLLTLDILSMIDQNKNIKENEIMNELAELNQTLLKDKPMDGWEISWLAVIIIHSNNLSNQQSNRKISQCRSKKIKS